MEPLRKRSVTIHGHDTTYRIGGPDLSEGAPVILLIHGMAGSSSMWRTVSPALAEDYTIVAPDLLGHGESDKPRHDYSLGTFASGLRDLMVALDIDRATLVGQSLGGGVAMQLSYQHPERCERLVLVCSGGLGTEVSWILRAVALPGAEYVMPVLFPSFMRDIGDAVNRRLTGLGLRAPHMYEEWRSYASLTDPETRQAFVRTLRAVVDVGGQTVSAHDRLYLASHVPMLIIWGARDHIIPIEHGRETHESLPHSRFEVFDHSGHFPQNEEPEHFVEVLHDFIETTEPARLDPSEWHAMLTGGKRES